MCCVPGDFFLQGVKRFQGESIFSFKDFDPWEFFGSLIRGLEVYNNKEVWEKLVRRCMEQDFSWEASAARYVDLYYKAIRLRRQELISTGQLLPSES